MDPEMIKNKQLNFKSDVYSFGIIAYEILTGNRSYTGLLKKFNSYDDIPNDVKPDLSLIKNEYFRDLIMRCISSDLHECPSFKEIISLLSNERVRNSMNVSNLELEKYYTFQCKKRADNKDPEAMNRLACMHLQGIKVRVDEKEIIRLFEMAIKDKNDKAMLNYANMLFLGIRTQKNKNKAIELYEMAAMFNNSYALANYGFILLSGDGVQKNKERAFSLWNMSALQGNTFGMNNLADAYRLGLGVQIDKLKAVEIYNEIIKRNDYKSLNEGVSHAMTALANMYRSGEGVNEDKTKAIQLLKQAIELDDDCAMVNLADMYQFGEGTPINIDEATRLYNLAIKNGNSCASDKLQAMNKRIKYVPIEYYDGLPIKKPKRWTYKIVPLNEFG